VAAVVTEEEAEVKTSDDVDGPAFMLVSMLTAETDE